MTPNRIASAALFALAVFTAAPAFAVDQVSAGREGNRRARLDIDVWVNRDEGGVYRSGERMRIYFRTNADAYVLLYNIDTEGFIHLLYPYGPADPPLVVGGRTVAVPSRSDPYELVAEGAPGVEYVVALASPVPFRNLPWFLGDGGRNGRDEELAGDGDEEEQGYVVGDPYVGMERLNQRIIPPGRADDVATSETWFYIERRVEYPRYVCADCHFHDPYFDPYVSVCSVVDIRIDATWIRYAPVRLGVVRPRYYYLVRSTAPTRYRQSKEQWSSRDGRSMLRERFIVGHDVKGRRDGVLKERSKAREYFDIRRSRPGRVWQGRDEVLRLRESREGLRRSRQELQDRARETRERGGQIQERRDPPVRERVQERREQPPVRERAQERRDPPPARERAPERREERVREKPKDQPRQDSAPPAKEKKSDKEEKSQPRERKR